MPVEFTNIEIGETYTRNELSVLWGYKSFQALSRGVVTPANSKTIVLIVTKEKQAALPQYADFIDGDTLFWEGEERHGSDQRIIKAETHGEVVHLFYRQRHHSPFTYYGRVQLKRYELRKDSPSQFEFFVPSASHVSDVNTDLQSLYQEWSIAETTKMETLVNTRLGQGQFRRNVIRLWGSCALTGLSNVSLLRASHIKPWRTSSNAERLDPYNGLLLQPTLDHLFDAGYITVNDDRSIAMSRFLTESDQKLLMIDPRWTLREMPEQTREYLQAHRQEVFRDRFISAL